MELCCGAVTGTVGGPLLGVVVRDLVRRALRMDWPWVVFTKKGARCARVDMGCDVS
jgi:hypothetical protein